ncbi:hypothetical protein PIB30_115326, partial [Stylosanthes scabra]|nr:hypothetical protein [Stylosanthes scabra]
LFSCQTSSIFGILSLFRLQRFKSRLKPTPDAPTRAARSHRVHQLQTASPDRSATVGSSGINA